MKNMKYALLFPVLFGTIIAPEVAADDNLNASYPSIDEVLSNIRNAEKAGADVSGLVVKFDEALDLLQQADKSNFTACVSHESCIAKANDILDSISNESISLQNQMEKASAFDRIMKLAVYSPVIAFATAFAAILVYRTWKSHKLKTYLDMDIAEKER